MTAEEILVIFLSTFLAIFLLLSIIALVSNIKLVKKLRQIADNAQVVSESVAGAAQAFRNAATPVAYGKAFANLMNMFNRNKRS